MKNMFCEAQKKPPGISNTPPRALQQAPRRHSRAPRTPQKRSKCFGTIRNEKVYVFPMKNNVFETPKGVIFSRAGVPPSSDSSPSYRSDVKFRPPRSTAPRANFNETFRAARTSHSASRHLVLTPSVTVRYGLLPPSSSPNARKTMVLAPSVTATPLGLYNNKEPWGWVWLDMNQLSA